MKKTVALVFAVLMCFALAGIASAEPSKEAVDHKTETFIEELKLNPDGASERAREKSKDEDQQSFVCLCSVSCWPEPHIWCSTNWCVGGSGCCSACYIENCINNCQ